MASANEAFEAFEAFELEADREMEGSPLMGLPARAFLAGIHYVIFTTRHAHQLSGRDNRVVADAIMQRVSGALSFIKNMASEPFGASAENAVDGFVSVDPDHRHLYQLLSYVHLCELAPEVRNKYLDVQETEAGFRLRNPDPITAQAQAKDITLSELAVALPLDAGGAIEPEFGKIAANLPEMDWVFMAHFVARTAHRYRLGLAEADLIYDEAIQRMCGLSRDQFLSIRSVLLAVAEFCEKLAVALHVDVVRGRLPKSRLAEAAEWASVNWKTDFLTEFVATGAHVQPDDVERFIELFSIDFRQSPAVSYGGDGFFPPFARFDSSVVFSPVLVLAFLQVRNAVFAVAKKDKKTFDDQISHDLEPVLLKQATALFARAGGWIVVEDVRYKGGQVDLVVGSPTSDEVIDVLDAVLRTIVLVPLAALYLYWVWTILRQGFEALF